MIPEDIDPDEVLASALGVAIGLIVAAAAFVSIGWGWS